MANDSPLPLDGVRVIDLTRLVPGAYCTLILADLGADVVKIEDPNGGDLMRTLAPHVGGLSVYHHALNRNKRSVTLDLRSADARGVLDRLVAGADVVVESFRPGTARRLKVSAGDLRAGHPRIVHCSLTGFGQSGPYVERAAHDLDFVALAGLFEVDQPEAFRPAFAEATADRPASAEGATASQAELRVPHLLVADIGGAWAAATAILAALFHRERSGRGSAVDIAMHDVAASWLTFPAAAAAMRAAPAPGQLPIGGDAACYNVYTTADGRRLALAAIEQKFWEAFSRRIGRPEFIALQWDPEEQPRLRDAVAATLRGRPAQEWLALFADIDVCLAPVNTVGEALNDQHLRHRGAVAAVGESRFIRAPIVFHAASSDDQPERLPIAPARTLGADTDDVLRSAGFDERDMARLRARRVL